MTCRDDPDLDRQGAVARVEAENKSANAPAPCSAAAPPPPPPPPARTQPPRSRMAAPAPPPVASPCATETIIKLYLHMQKDAHEKAVAEIRRGRKTSHWIWWEWPAFTPVRTTSRKEFDLPSCGACTAWLAHPTLGTRWADITRLAVGHLESGAP